jgi:hypothetical protein
MASIEIIDDTNIVLYVNEGIPDVNTITTTSVSTLTNKTITFADNTLTGVQPLLVSATNIKTVNGATILGAGDIAVLSPNVANQAITNAKTITFNSQPTMATTTGAITIDWTAAQNYKQATPTGAITYTFTAPPGICHLQLMIATGATPQVITFPATVKWQIFTWTGVANKTAIINFWFDGTNYWAMGSNEV